MKHVWKAMTLTVIALSVLILFPKTANADVVTDTLTVKVGYYGMDPEDYVEVDTFSWWELEEQLPMHEQAYSFFQDGSTSGDGTVRTVVDSAYGFYIADLLSHCGIYQNDVNNISFYTRDKAVGYFTSLTAEQLFGNDRYYFENLRSHLVPIRDEYGNVIAYNDTEAWDYATLVQPMLALEDNWSTFDLSFDDTPPNFDGMTSTHRFRLLFGQSDPLEHRTNQSAKYVHTILVTLDGTAIYTQNTPVLDTSIGSHTVTMEMTVSSKTLLNSLQSFLDFQSTDGKILSVTGWSVTESEDYSDLVFVEISYDVLEEGEASITGSIGGVSGAMLPSISSGSSGGDLSDNDSSNTGDGAGSGTSGREETKVNIGDAAVGNSTQSGQASSGTQVSISTSSSDTLHVELEESGNLNDGMLELFDGEVVTLNGVRAIPLSASLAAALLDDSQIEETESAQQEEQVDLSGERTALEIQEKEIDKTSYMGIGAGILFLLLFGAISEKRYIKKAKVKAV